MPSTFLVVCFTISTKKVEPKYDKNFHLCHNYINYDTLW